MYKLHTFLFPFRREALETYSPKFHKLLVFILRQRLRRKTQNVNHPCSPILTGTGIEGITCRFALSSEKRYDKTGTRGLENAGRPGVVVIGMRIRRSRVRIQSGFHGSFQLWSAPNQCRGAPGPAGRLGPHSRALSASRTSPCGRCSDRLTGTAVFAVLSCRRKLKRTSVSSSVAIFLIRHQC